LHNEVGVLTPAEVDPNTNYRRYRRDQLGEARIICQLRSVDLPVEEVRSVLEADDVDAVRDVLLRHQDRLAERAQRLQRMIETSHTYLDHGVPPRPPAEPRPVQIVLATHDREQLVDLYRMAFGWKFNDDISSFTLGAYHPFLLHRHHRELERRQPGMLRTTRRRRRRPASARHRGRRDRNQRARGLRMEAAQLDH
jgi:DNA-binding transcriptional MerR regulator